MSHSTQDDGDEPSPILVNVSHMKSMLVLGALSLEENTKDNTTMA